MKKKNGQNGRRMVDTFGQWNIIIHVCLKIDG